MTKYLAIVTLALGLLTGCLGFGDQPSTPREKLFIAEVAYEASLREVKSLVGTGFVRKDSPTAKTIAEAIRQVRALLDQWQATPDNPSYAVLVAGATARLTTLLITLRTKSEGFGGIEDYGGWELAIKHPRKPPKPRKLVGWPNGLLAAKHPRPAGPVKPPKPRKLVGIQPIVRAA